MLREKKQKIRKMLPKWYKKSYFTKFFIEGLDISTKYGWIINVGATYSGVLNNSDGWTQESRIAKWPEIDRNRQFQNFLSCRQLFLSAKIGFYVQKYIKIDGRSFLWRVSVHVLVPVHMSLFRTLRGWSFTTLHRGWGRQGGGGVKLFADFEILRKFK